VWLEKEWLYVLEIITTRKYASLKSIWCLPWRKLPAENKCLPPRRRMGKLPYKRTAAVDTATLTHDYLAVQPSFTFTIGADLSIFSLYRKKD